MTEETLKRLRAWAARQERMEYERDVLILRSRRDGDKMTDVAQAAGLSRQHAYRIAAQAEVDFETVSTDLGDERTWQVADEAKTWPEFYKIARGSK